MFGLVLAVCGLAMLGFLVLQGWTMAHLIRQQGAITNRIEAVSGRLDRRTFVPSAGVAAPIPTPVAIAPQAPAFTLPTLKGNQVSLADLRARNKPVLLFFMDSRCAPCEEVLPDIGTWQREYIDQLTIAVVTAGDPQLNLQMAAHYKMGLVLMQAEFEVIRDYGIEQAPAMVTIDLDGAIRRDIAYGVPEIRALMAALTGVSRQSAPTPAPAAGPVLIVGDLVPKLSFSDISGQAVDLVTPHAPSTILLFWSPTCSHCQKVATDVRAWESASAAANSKADVPRLVIISSGVPAANLSAGFAAPLILDDDRTLKQLFDIKGTPAAILVDANGRITAEPLRGGKAVEALFKPTVVA